MSLRPITGEGFSKPVANLEAGPAPMLQWIDVALLRVDESYQRPVQGAGRVNVGRIAEQFRWSKFAPIVVSPIPGGLFAVIDGQHRAIAAALRGLDTLPAQVVVADATEQAAAFKAINAATTRISALQLHRAALAAGDAEAREVQEAADAAGVVILRHPTSHLDLKPGETMALGAIRSALKEHGRDTVVTALMCVTETSNNEPGVLGAATIKALCTTLGARPDWREAGERLLAAFDEIDLLEEANQARFSYRAKGTAVAEILTGRITTRLQVSLDRKQAA